MRTTQSVPAAVPPAKAAILAESLKLFASRGVEAVSVRDISAATGFTNPALFRHFAGKEALAGVLFEQCYRTFGDALAPAPHAGLSEWLAAAIHEIAANPAGVHFVLENVRRYWPMLPAELRVRNLPALTRAMLAAEQAAGRVRADVDTALAAVIVLGALGQLARAAHFDGATPPVAATAAALAALLLEGMRPR